MAKPLKYYNNRLMGSLTEQQCRQLETVIKLKEENKPIEELKHIIYTLSDKQVEECIDDEVSIPISERPIGTLTDYQTLSVGFGFIAEDALLGDSVGLGKTVEASALINLKRKEKYERFGNVQGFRCLFLTEKDLAEQVREEVVRFTGEYTELLWGEKKYVKKFQNKYISGVDGTVVGVHSLINQQEFYSWMDYLQDGDKDYKVFDLLIIDESSFLGNTNTKTRKNAEKLKKYCSHVIELNAQPFETNLEYVYGQLEFLDKDYLPTKTEFKNTYFKFKMNLMNMKEFTGEYKNYEDFKHRVGYRYFFQTRKDQGAKIINVNSEILFTSLSKEQNKLLRETSMPKMVYDSPSILDPSIPFNEETCPKLGLLKDVLSKAQIERGEQVIIYSIYKESQDLLREYIQDEFGYHVDVLNGDVSKELRSTIIKNFKNNSVPILITNVQKGLNFGSVKTVVFYSFDPNPSKMLQLEGRVTRSFDIENKDIYLLTTRGKEFGKIKNVVAKRYDYTTKFTSEDISGIGTLLLKILEEPV